jgi:hypothetical protein
MAMIFIKSDPVNGVYAGDMGVGIPSNRVPVVKDLASRILQIVESGKGQLEMDDYHTCESTHCIAGWTTHLAGKRAKVLEEELFCDVAAAAIWLKTYGSYPSFSHLVEHDEALDSLRRFAALDSEPSS